MNPPFPLTEWEVVKIPALAGRLVDWLESICQGSFTNLFRLRQQSGCAGVFGTGDQGTAGRKMLDEFQEGSLQICQGGVAIRMVVFQICDHFDVRLQTQEHAIIFISLDDKGAALPVTGIGSQVCQHTSHDEGWIAVQCRQYPCNHGGGSGLAVRSGDGYAVFTFHQVGQDVGPFQHRDPAGTCRNHFGIVIRDGGRAHHQVDSFDILRTVADLDGDAGRLQIPGEGGIRRDPIRSPCVPFRAGRGRWQRVRYHRRRSDGCESYPR